MGNWPRIALAAPAGVLTVALAVALVMAAVGRSPIWTEQNVTLSEAILTGDEGELVALMSRGADANMPYDVRPGLLSERSMRITPLEAAVRSRRGDLIESLVKNGAVVDAGIWNRLRCLTGDDGVSAVLERYRPADAAMRCEDAAASEAAAAEAGTVQPR